MSLSRTDRTIDEMKKLGITQLMVTDPDSILYYTGIYNSPFERFWGFLIKANGEHVLFANKLFRLRPIDCRVVVFDDVDPLTEVVCPHLEPGLFGVDGNMAARFLLPIAKAVPGLEPVLAQSCISSARSRKDEEEKENMRIASRINDETMAKVRDFIHEGATENEIAAFIKKCYSQAGAGGESFTPIVCFGAHASDPHHHPTDTVLKDGDCILIDMGCKWNGYCSDMTRTFYWKTVSDEDRKIYEITLEANLKGIAAVKAGRHFKEVDLAARDHIASFGYGPNFTHRLGHGIGIAEHEGDDVSQVNDHLIEKDMCFSIEPGIYLAGKTGVRIEDLVIATEDGCELLNHFSKELTVLGI
ncbi:MAG: aminopeptidase P family protein [Firmicutes bacterium]|nr:aminopeptidase P family protein [Bacillota bacterium]